MQLLVLFLEDDVLACLRHLHPCRIHPCGKLMNFEGFAFHSLEQTYFCKSASVLAVSCSSGLINVTSSMNIVLCNILWNV